MKNQSKPFLLVLGAIIASLVFLASCSDQSEEQLFKPDLKPLAQVEEDVISSANNFSFELLAKIHEEEKNQNVFISPFSVSTALSMTLNGAGGTTKENIKEVLGLTDLSDEEVNEAYKNLVAALFAMDNKVTLDIANSTWYRNDQTIKPKFEEVLLEYYNAEVYPADFGPGTVEEINGWIEDKTNGKIKDMLDAIPVDAFMYLINAIYFKADWTYKFKESETEDRPFYLEDGSEIQTPTMFSEGVVLGYASDSVQAVIDIPYGNGQFSFTVLLPHQEYDVNQVIERMTIERFSQLLADTTHRSVEVYLPKFKLEYKKELKPTLQAMGMNEPFAGGADFSGLIESNMPKAISRVIHQSFLEVNEAGSEAAAATIVEFSFTSTTPNGGVPQSIKIDRPFAFLIREKHTNAILFAGKLMNPVE